MRLAVAGGGTGGHIYPAVSVIEALGKTDPALQVMWLGVAGGPEESIANDQGWAFAPVSAARVRGTGLRAPLGVYTSIFGSLGAAQHLRRFSAQVLLATGGYVSVPSIVGAKLVGVPVLLFLPDVQPGWAVRFSRWLANVVATTSEVARRWLGGSRVIVTGYPVREAFFAMPREQARRKLELNGRPALLVLGGSLGARSLNQATLKWVPSFLPAMQVIHVAGRRDYPWVKEEARRYGLDRANGYRLFEYLESLPEAMIAVDLVLSRAGASVLGELPAAGKPAVLVPYPYAGAHQRDNARYLEEKGAAVVLENDDLDSQLGPMVERLLSDPVALVKMAEQARGLARPHAAEDLARSLVELAEGTRA